jgi:3-oxoacyl-[acyl-carrier protein] reductase
MPYACAKAALLMYAQELARRLAYRAIRVNSVSPGNLMFQGSTWEKKLVDNEDATLSYIKNNVPLGRFVSPLSVASAVLNACENADLTGHNLVIDAGQLMGKQHV